MTTVGNISVASNGVSKGTTHICFILDKSASMGRLRTEIVSEFNNQIKVIKKSFKDLDTKVSLVTFDSVVTEVFFEKDLSELNDLKESDYIPEGMTAMNDGIGYVITKYRELNDTDPMSAYLYLILTDGDENSSRKYSGANISSMIKELKETGKHTFTVLGANIDLDKLTIDLNLDVKNVQVFQATSHGITKGLQSTSRGIENYSQGRHLGSTITLDFYSDKN